MAFLAVNTVLRTVISTWLDSVDPSDAMQITPHFRVVGSSEDPQVIANDLMTAWSAWISVGVSSGTQMRVTVYDARGAKPNYPLASKEVGTGTAYTSNVNRDIAICLSYYSTVNRPRHRGRLYIPVQFVGGSVSGANVDGTAMTKVGTLAGVLSGLHSANLDWGVYSRKDDTHRTATNWYVDDAWDTQRRRGKRPTSRTAGTTVG